MTDRNKGMWMHELVVLMRSAVSADARLLLFERAAGLEPAAQQTTGQYAVLAPTHRLRTF